MMPASDKNSLVKCLPFDFNKLVYFIEIIAKILLNDPGNSHLLPCFRLWDASNIAQK